MSLRPSARCSASSRDSTCRLLIALFLRDQGQRSKRCRPLFSESRSGFAGVSARPSDRKRMKLRALFSDEIAIDKQAGTIDVSGLAMDSRVVKPGDLFFALAGA